MLAVMLAEWKVEKMVHWRVDGKDCWKAEKMVDM